MWQLRMSMDQLDSDVMRQLLTRPEAGGPIQHGRLGIPAAVGEQDHLVGGQGRGANPVMENHTN